MTLEEALAEPGRKVLTSAEDQRLVTVYGLASGGAKILAELMVAGAQHDALVAALRARGCELAASEVLTRIVWVITADGIEVYDQRRKQLDASGDRATLREGRIVARPEFAKVFAWASDQYAHRGIKAALRSGEEVELVTEISLAATGDPTYNRNDLLFDSGWCVALGRAIASWAGTTFEDQI